MLSVKLLGFIHPDCPPSQVGIYFFLHASVFIQATSGPAIMKALWLLLCFFLHSALAAKRTFELTLSWKTGVPTDVEREMIYVNDKFPGPTLHIKQGDNVEVEVVNNLDEETTIHFHGMDSICVAATL
jgi:FtsP/CotA-like multicopper oxidase with cupredoxin domain